MGVRWEAFVEFVKAGLSEFRHTEFGQVRYADRDLAIALSIAILALLLLKTATLAVRRRKHSRQHSGHFIAFEHRRGFWGKAIPTVPKLILAVVLALLLVAIADPFLTSTEEVSGYVESRIRVDLVDTSGSMAWEFPDTGKSKAEVARDAHLAFLKMRQGKNDRVSLWLFSTYPYMVDDFVLDDELYYFQVYDAPYVTIKRVDRAMVVPRDKVKIIPAEGDTNIVRPLQAIIRYFDRDATEVTGEENNHRALLILTDAAVDEYPDAEFEELNRRNIVPYIIFIDTSDPRTAGAIHRNTPRLIEQIRHHGGDYFDVSDTDSLARAYQAIDEREAVRVEMKHRALKVPIYARFLLVAITILLMAIPVGLTSEMFWGMDP